METIQYLLDCYRDGMFVVLSKVDSGSWHVSRTWQTKLMKKLKARAERDGKERIFVFDEHLFLVSSWELTIERKETSGD